MDNYENIINKLFVHQKNIYYNYKLLDYPILSQKKMHEIILFHDEKSFLLFFHFYQCFKYNFTR